MRLIFRISLDIGKIARYRELQHRFGEEGFMKRILYIVSTLGISGPTNQLHGLTSNLKSGVYEPIILTLSPESQKTLIHHFKRKGTIVESLKHNRLSGMLRNRSGISKAILQYRPEIIHTQGFRASCLLGKMTLPCPCITTIRNDPCFDFSMKFGKLRGTWMAKKYIQAIRAASIGICCSQAIENTFREKYKVSNVMAIQNGVNTDKYHPIEALQRETLRKNFGFTNDTKIFLSVSSLVKGKDIATLIRSFKIANIKSSKLILLGDGSERQALESIANFSPNIHFVGNVNNVDEYLAASDFFISASLSEGLPNSVLEAMASGLPVVLSDIPSHREILSLSNSAEDFLFPVKDEKAAAHVLQEIVEMDYQETSAQMRSIILSRFSNKAMANNYQKIYEQCITQNGGQCG